MHINLLEKKKEKVIGLIIMLKKKVKKDKNTFTKNKNLTIKQCK